MVLILFSAWLLASLAGQPARLPRKVGPPRRTHIIARVLVIKGSHTPEVRSAAQPQRWAMSDRYERGARPIRTRSLSVPSVDLGGEDGVS